MRSKVNCIFILFLTLEIQAGYGMPQGFSFPRLVSWNNNERSLTILPNVKVQSPVKSSFLNLFGKQNSVDNIDLSKKEQLDNTNKIEQGNEKLTVGHLPSSLNAAGNTERNKNEDNNRITFPDDEEDKELISKFSAIVENSTNKIYNEATTETTAETTTYDYETTTVDDDIFNRASPQLVASLLG